MCWKVLIPYSKLLYPLAHQIVSLKTSKSVAAMPNNIEAIGIRNCYVLFTKSTIIILLRHESNKFPK